jgi:hypothetical protein
MSKCGDVDIFDDEIYHVDHVLYFMFVLLLKYVSPLGRHHVMLLFPSPLCCFPLEGRGRKSFQLHFNLVKYYASSFELSCRELFFSPIPSADRCLNPISPRSTSSPTLSSDDTSSPFVDTSARELSNDSCGTSISTSSSSPRPRADCMMSSMCAERTSRRVGG